MYCSKDFHHVISLVNILYLNQITPPLLSLTLFSPLPIIPQLSVCFLMPSSYIDTMHFNFIRCHSLVLSFLLLVPSTGHTIVNVVNIYILCMNIWSWLCIYLSFGPIIFHIWEKTYDLCLSELGLLHLTWCSPVPSIYLRMT
jgi:hypothetical protein